MKAKVIEDADVVTYVVVCDPGDEAVSRADAIRAGQNGWRPPRSPRSARSSTRPSAGSTARPSDYRRIQVDEQCELLSLIGDVAEGQDGPILHVHAVLGLSDGTTRGGHLLEGRVFPTLEAIVTETPAELRKMTAPRYRDRAHRPGSVRVMTWPGPTASPSLLPGFEYRPVDVGGVTSAAPSGGRVRRC